MYSFVYSVTHSKPILFEMAAVCQLFDFARVEEQSLYESSESMLRTQTQTASETMGVVARLRIICMCPGCSLKTTSPSSVFVQAV